MTGFDAPTMTAHSDAENDLTDLYFDYTSSARPWDYSIDQSGDVSGWFFTQIFAALRETELACSPSIPEEWSSAILAHSGPFGS